MSTPRVSICIPSYRQPLSLRRALDSVTRQSFSNYEVIVSDDSEDDSVERVVEEVSLGKKLRYCRNLRRLGVPENWNQAIRMAEGEYIKILHHDDWFAGVGSLGEYVRLLDENPCADLGFSACSAYGEGPVYRFHHAPTHRQLAALARNPMSLYPHNFIGSPSDTIVRSSAGLLFDANLKWVVDIDYYIAILKQNPCFVYSSTPLVCITAGVGEQVTAECEGNRDVELYEWIYLYRKLAHIVPSPRNAAFVWRLLAAYQVASLRQLREVGLRPPWPISVVAMISARFILFTLCKRGGM